MPLADRLIHVYLCDRVLLCVRNFCQSDMWFWWSLSHSQSISFKLFSFFKLKSTIWNVTFEHLVDKNEQFLENSHETFDWCSLLFFAQFDVKASNIHNGFARPLFHKDFVWKLYFQLKFHTNTVRSFSNEFAEKCQLWNMKNKTNWEIPIKMDFLMPCIDNLCVNLLMSICDIWLNVNFVKQKLHIHTTPLTYNFESEIWQETRIKFNNRNRKPINTFFFCSLHSFVDSYLRILSTYKLDRPKNSNLYFGVCLTERQRREKKCVLKRQENKWMFESKKKNTIPIENENV